MLLVVEIYISHCDAAFVDHFLVVSCICFTANLAVFFDVVSDVFVVGDLSLQNCFGVKF